MRQIVLDTETTGLEPSQGHRIIEIGCIELLDRRPTGERRHWYLNPDREVDEGALEVHGISLDDLKDKPRFVDIAEDLLSFLRGAQLLAHNASFDVGFLDYELSLLDSAHGKITDYCQVLDTLAVARQKRPGQKNNLDALCKHYGVDNSRRDLHGALVDAQLLAEVYLLMTGGQTRLSLDTGDRDAQAVAEPIRRLPAQRTRLSVISASGAELEAHKSWLAGQGAKLEMDW